MKKKIALIIKQNILSFITYEIHPCVYLNKRFSEVFHTMGDYEGTLEIKNDDISMKTKPILTRFGLKFGTLGFGEKSFLSILLSFTTFCDYKPTNAIHFDSPGVH